MADISLRGLNKSYGSVRVLNDFSLDIADGEFVVLVGPSGCGKSTTLKILAGLDDATSGSVFIGGRDVTDLAPADRDIAMVFQNYALYPHLTVRKNMGFGLKMRGMPAAEIGTRVERVARTLALDPLLERRPRELSGGQRQRVALGRAIVREPQAFLMDEPLSNLDAKLRVRMRSEISGIHKRLGVTTVYVTHDQTEAMTMADRIVIMRDGVTQQVATPAEMYARPRNLFVASFIGSPGMNFVQSHVLADGGDIRIRLFGETISLPQNLAQAASRRRFVAAGVRPEHFMLGDGPVSFEAVPTLVESLGSEMQVHVDVPAENRIELAAEAWDGEQRQNETFIVRLPATRPVTEGSRMRLSFDPKNIHLFDIENHITLA